MAIWEFLVGNCTDDETVGGTLAGVGRKSDSAFLRSGRSTRYLAWPTLAGYLLRSLPKMSSAK